ncbi:DegT/DnrJ/EryC1/StrS family aminotransferase [Jiangella anatolica]|uniref:DegT/DnrJ/EryC1/StrS family aminotransferase n=1 Tax=Jiangella anatolica TaxID=2670374 RepID=A0A2W2CII9_9ACTN|nr:DegT/DnrJ/EryC1/StrS family aminotransferase [Jiangella anatolica]PZF80023.1 DegT/DnrJ/EryC1/StrS family aminotransferase [Jiangella anatolica]
MTIRTALAIDGGTPLRTRGWPAWPPPADEAQRALLHSVVDSGNWGATDGHLCDDLATAFAGRHGCRHGVTVANATLALFASLIAAGVGPGDEVVIPGYTFVASATSVLLLGATPVIADVDPRHLHLTGETAAMALTPRTRAIMAVHLAGSPAPMDDLRALARENGLVVVEDAAQAHGAGYRGRPVGSLGDVAAFSFQSTKAMTAGEGGLITTNDPALAGRAWSACNVGRVRGGYWYDHATIGWNLRMTQLQAALLIPWLDRLDDEIERREQFVRQLASALAGSDLPVRILDDPDGTDRNSRHLLLLRLGTDSEPVDKEWVVRALTAEGVPVDRGFPNLGRLPAVARRSTVLPTPGVDLANAAVVWLRQNVLMAAPDAVADIVAALERVLTDPRAIARGH